MKPSSITKIFQRRSNESKCSRSKINDESNASGKTIIDDESIPMGFKSSDHVRVGLTQPPKTAESAQKTALLAAAKKYKEGDEALNAGDYETAKQLFNQTLRARLLLFGADSELVSRCHYKLLKIACVESDDEKIDYHKNAIVRASDARDMEEILKTCSKLLGTREN